MNPRIDTALSDLITPMQKTAALNLRGIGAGARAMTPSGGVPLAARMATQSASVRGMPMRAMPAPRPKPQLTWASPAQPVPAAAPMPNSGGAATLPPDFIAKLLRGAAAGIDFPINIVKSHPRAALGLGTAAGLGYGIKSGLLDPVRQALEGGIANPANRR